MKLRSTEKPHSFSDRLFKTLQVHSLQGLTLASSDDFTAGVEAVEYGPGEKVIAKNLFQTEEWEAKWCICSHLSIPLYLMMYEEGSKFLEVLQVYFVAGKFESHHHGRFSFDQFANWWASIKGTRQKKPLHEARSRISFFDDILAKYGLAWGGNVDGFLLDSKMRAQAIIETRYSTKKPLEEYDPAVYFRYRNGDYNTWKPLILLSTRLKVPLFLLTFERGSAQERLGFSVIDSISNEKLFYRGSPPCNYIISGVENIRQRIEEMISEKPPHIRSD